MSGSITNETDRLRVELSRARKLVLFLGAALLLSLGAILKVAGSHTTTLVPPSIEKGFWVSQNKVEASYLEQMANYVVGLSENYTPKNIEYKHKQLLDIADPEFYSSLSSALLEKAMHVKRNNISSVFHESSAIVDEKKMMVQIGGQLSIFIGTEREKPVNKRYLVTFGYKHGHLSVKSIKEVSR